MNKALEIGRAQLSERQYGFRKGKSTIDALEQGQNEDQLRMKANKALQQLNNWLELNKLELAPQKTEAVILVGRNSIKELTVEIEEDRITRSMAIESKALVKHFGTLLQNPEDGIEKKQDLINYEEQSEEEDVLTDEEFWAIID
ncbi:hypothetical protein ILUMI_21790 [Ignelater luminosus]|uniref:Uncharacterized protein n=1 Tax=Ignelater luminosus TaxID=2038154 RepID=A0A8K0CFU1_IGNLU|nr:hypothetical protein ILUMI_21790 [Ignelater luminosus]